MEISRFSLFLFALILAVGLRCEAGGGGEILGWLTSTGSAGCRGTIAECLGSEFEMDSEINRRVLASADDYISYRALEPDSVPSCAPGFSYYNDECKPNEVNPDPNTRTCDKSAGCRSA